MTFDSQLQRCAWVRLAAYGVEASNARIQCRCRLLLQGFIAREPRVGGS